MIHVGYVIAAAIHETLESLYSEVKDAVKEGDGNRVGRCWQFFLLYFKPSHCKNYSTEALNLPAQFNVLHVGFPLDK